MGKSFLLDVAWWVLTGKWVEQIAYPRQAREGNPEINCLISTAKDIKQYQSYFDFSEQQWRNLRH